MEGLRAPDICVKLGQTDAHSFTLYFNSSFPQFLSALFEALSNFLCQMSVWWRISG